MKLSPAPGTLVRPSTCTGREGGASSTVSPFSSSIARTRPNASPATIESPIRNVPRCTSTVEGGGDDDCGVADEPARAEVVPVEDGQPQIQHRPQHEEGKAGEC